MKHTTDIFSDPSKRVIDVKTSYDGEGGGACGIIYLDKATNEIFVEQVQIGGLPKTPEVSYDSENEELDNIDEVVDILKAQGFNEKQIKTILEL